MNCLKSLSIIVLVGLFLTNTIVPIESLYQDAIKQSALEWTNKYIENHNSLETKTIIDLLFLSYQIVTESCKMVLAKFTMQQELFKIYTPSFIDSWHENLQFHQNDTKKLETALATIKSSQTNLEHIYEQFKKLIPHILKMNPQPTQTLIIDLKNLLLTWVKDQQLLTDQLIGIQQEFSDAIGNISDFKNLFQTVSQTQEIKHVYLKEAASFYAKTYKEIDLATDHLVGLRITGIVKIQQFFECFFKTYYVTIHNKLHVQHDTTLFL